MLTYKEWLLSKKDDNSNKNWMDKLLSLDIVIEGNFDTPSDLIRLANREWSIVCWIEQSALDYLDYLNQNNCVLYCGSYPESNIR